MHHPVSQFLPHHTPGSQPPTGSGYLRLRQLWLCVLTFFSITTQAQESWIVEEARLRLCTEADVTDQHNLRIDLPPQLSHDIRGARVFLYGQEMPASPIFLRDEMLAIEVAIPAGTSGKSGGQTRLPLHVYLLEQPANTAPRPADTRPVALYGHSIRLVTRPSTYPELIALEAAIPPPPFVADLRPGEAIDAVLPETSREALRLHFTTTLMINEETTARVGASPPNTAWFLLVNGRLAAAWKTYDRRTINTCLSAPITFSPGLHRLDLVVIRNPGEPTPVMYWQKGERNPVPISSDVLYSAHQSRGWRLDDRRQQVNPGVEATNQQTIFFRDTDSVIQTFILRNLTTANTGTPPPGVLVRTGNTTAAFNELIAYPGRVLPDLALTVAAGSGSSDYTVTFPGGFRWARPQIAQPLLEVKALPVVIADKTTIELQAKVQGIPAQLIHTSPLTTAVRWRLLDAVDDQLASGYAAVDNSSAVPPLPIPLLTDAAAIELTLTSHGAPLTPPFTIRLLRPEAQFADLEPRGERLLLNHRPAILVTSSAATSVTTAESRRPQPRLLLVDEGLMNSTAPEAGLHPGQWLTTRLPYQAEHLPVLPAADREAVPDLRKFGLLQAVFEQRPAVVVWAVGLSDLRNQHVTIGEICSRLRFLAQATWAHGAKPVLLTIPEMPDLPQTRTYEAALEIKRLAHDLGISVVDAYSRAAAELPPGRGFAAFFTTSEPGFQLDSLNDEGRRWLCNLIRETVLDSGTPNRTRTEGRR
jgi:hypothetical protein